MSVCLSIFLCEYMNLVGGGDCVQCVNTFVWQVAGLCSDLRPPQHTAPPLPLRILPKRSTSYPSSREQARLRL